MRNDRNFLIFESDGDAINIEPRLEKLNREELDQFFNRNFSFAIEQNQQAILFDQPVRIACEVNDSVVTVFLLIEGEQPYSIEREGTEIASGLTPDDFPYEDNPEQKGEYCYTITDQLSDTDETCCVV